MDDLIPAAVVLLEVLLVDLGGFVGDELVLDSAFAVGEGLGVEID
jgi:hypothetical protein